MKYSLLALFFFCTIRTSAQVPSLNDLVSFVKMDVSSINDKLTVKDWQYLNSKNINGDYKSTWAYKLNVDSTASAWFYIESKEGYLNTVILTFFNKVQYGKLMADIKNLGLKKVHSSISEDTGINTIYKGKNYVYDVSVLEGRYKIVVFEGADFARSLIEAFKESGATVDTIPEQ